LTEKNHVGSAYGEVKEEARETGREGKEKVCRNRKHRDANLTKLGSKGKKGAAFGW